MPEMTKSLRTITRHMASAEDLETVLRSITSALVEHADAVASRCFLLMTDLECPVCRRSVDAGTHEPVEGRALHVLAEAGPISATPWPFHRIPIESDLPAALLVKSRTPSLVPDWRMVPEMMRQPRVAELWNEMGIESIAGYPLEFRGELLGGLGYLSRRRIEPLEFELLGIYADQAAMAIKNAYLFRDRERYKDRLQVENAYLQEEVRLDHSFEHIVGTSAALKGVIRKVRQVAPVDSTVLLLGETGTGKELVARAIHEGSPRRERAMIKVNCGAISPNLVESELFGHEKGAFTGAVQKRIGRFELADRSTLFMDEVGELSLDTQVKLLRVLQEREFERVGSARPVAVDVRLIAATHRDLEQEAAAGRFRRDLFYRLNVFPIRIPPLRERPEDVPELVRHFLAQLQRKLGKPLDRVSPAALEQLQRYPWPGNVRELQNVLERACVLARGPVVDLPDALRAPPAARGAPDDAGAAIPTLADHERAQIRRALSSVNGRIHGPGGAAELLGINASTLRSRMQKLGVGKA